MTPDFTSSAFSGNLCFLFLAKGKRCDKEPNPLVCITKCRNVIGRFASSNRPARKTCTASRKCSADAETESPVQDTRCYAATQSRHAEGERVGISSTAYGYTYLQNNSIPVHRHVNELVGIVRVKN